MATKREIEAAQRLAAKTANKYCDKRGRAVRDDGDEKTHAENAWTDSAEIIHCALRKIKTDEGRAALLAFENLGKAIARDAR